MNVVPEIALLMNCIEEPVKFKQACIAYLVNKYLEFPAQELESKDLSCLTDTIQFSISLAETVSIEFSLSSSLERLKTTVMVQGLQSRAQSASVNQELASWMLENDHYDLTFYDVYQEAKTRIAESAAVSHQSTIAEDSSLTSEAKPEFNQTSTASHSAHSGYSRIMFFAHHLLATSKRQELKKLALTLDLHILVKVGYPGLIAAEGERSNIEFFKQKVKSMRWHTIALRYDMHTALHNQQTWLDHAILKDRFLETEGMDSVAAELKADREWFMSIMH